MTRTPAARRQGLGLLEVIVAMFVMALGMISLLTLFPLGAIQMGHALRNARAAETAMQADTLMRLWWQAEVVERPGNEDLPFAAMDDPRNTFDTTNPLVALAATEVGPSYPVCVDPLGWQSRNGLAVRQWRLAGQAPDNGVFPRRSIRTILSQPLAAQPALSFRAASMMDDITFNPTGTPDTGASGIGAQVVRQGRYNWAAVIQRPVNANRYVADLKILVFDGRPPGIAPLDAEKIGVPTAPLAAGTSQLVLNVGAAPPEYLRAGSWIMDGTLTPPVGPAAGVRNAVWYRVQTIDKESLPGAYIIDLQTPLTRDVTTASQFYIFRGLLDVFDRPQLAPTDYKRQLP